MRLSALESVQTAAEELIKQAGNSQDEAVKGKTTTDNLAPYEKEMQCFQCMYVETQEMLHTRKYFERSY